MFRKLKNRLKNYLLKLVLILVWGGACYWFFQSQYEYHFFYQEQNQLFLMDWEYVWSYMDKPAWLGCLIGDFLTQFYYYLYAGAAILTITLLLLGDQLRQSLDYVFKGLKSKTLFGWISFTIAIAVITVLARLSLYEGYRLSSIICVIGVCILYNFRCTMLWMTKNKVQPLTLIAFYLLALWMFGYMANLMSIFELMRISCLCCQKKAKTWALIPIMFIAFASIIGSDYYASSYNQTRDEAVLYPAKYKWVDWESEKILEKNFKYDNEYYFGHYSKVIAMYEDELRNSKEKESTMTEEMCFFYCLSLAQQDMLPDKLMTMESPILGTFYKIGEDTPLYTIKMINELYYLLGDMTYAERAALLANTFSPNGRNVRMIKRLAEANLVNGDCEAASKYLRLLEKTLVYKDWAKDRKPGTMAREVKAEIERKNAFINKTDKIRIGDDCYTILTQLLDSNPNNTIALDYLLCSDIIARQKDLFMKDYETYGPRMKPLYQQALSME